MSIKRIAVFFSAFILVFAYTFFFAQATGESLTATVGSACAVNLVWTPGNGVTPGNFEVRYTTNPNFNGTNTSLNFSSSTRSAQITGLTQGTDYRFDIKGLYTPPDVTRTKSNPNVVKTDALPSKPGRPQNVSGSLDLLGGRLQTKIDFGIPGMLSSKFSSYGGFSIKRDGVEISSSTLPATGLVYSFVDNSNGLVSTKKYVYDIAAFESDLGCGSTRVTSDTYSVTIPSAPTNVAANFVFDKLLNTYETTVSWTPGVGQDSIELYRDGILIKTLGASVSSYKDVSAQSGQTYTYTVRGKHSSGGSSAFAASNKITISNTPQNVQASVTSITSKFASITLTWDNTNPGENYIVKYGTSTTDLQIYQNRGFAFTSEQIPTIKIDNLPINKNYYFQVEFEDIGAPSEQIMVNTTIKYRLSGQAWSNIDGHGIGWVKFACDATDPACGGQEFSVYVDGDGYLHGGAWTSVDVDGHGYGWLSFEKTHLTGCPQGTCAAKLMDNGEIRGWARFYNPNGQAVSGSYEWVALNSMKIEGGPLSGIAPYSFAQLKDSFKSLISSPSFGDIWGVVKYSILSIVDVVKTYALEGSWGLEIKPGGDGKEYVQGQAWGGDIVGWIGFSICGNDLCDVVAEGAGVLGKFTIQSERTRLVPRERTNLWVVPGEVVSWSLNPNGFGTLNPISNTSTTLFTATSSVASQTNVKIIASSTTETASTTLTIEKDIYDFSCTPQKGSNMVNWTGKWSDTNYLTYVPHTVALSYATSATPVAWKPISSFGGGPRVYQHNSLSSSTAYWYKLESGIFDSPLIAGPCTPLRSVSDEPSRFGVFTVDEHTLIANWRDNATTSAGYTFEVERMKLTPASSTAFAVATTGPSLVTSQKIPLTWKNITTSTPFYAWIERSSSTVDRFRNKNGKTPTYPGCLVDAVNGDVNCKIETNVAEFWPTVTPTSSAKIKTFTGKPITYNFTYDSSVGREGEATTFFYQIRACSSITPVYTKCDAAGSVCELDTDFQRNPVCSVFASSTNGKVIATTTPPLPVINVTSTKPQKINPNNLDTLYWSDISWKDDSVRETGMFIQRNGETLVEENGTTTFKYVDKVDIAKKNFNGVKVKIFTTPLGTRNTTFTFRDEKMQPGTTYSYKIIPYFDVDEDPIDKKFVRVYSEGEAASTNQMTAYRVQIAVGGDGSNYGRVTGDYGMDTLKPDQKFWVHDFDPSETATVEYSFWPVSNGNEYVDFTRWDGISCTNQTCTLPKQNSNPTAVFTRLCYDYGVSVNPTICATSSQSVANCTHLGGDYERDSHVWGSYDAKNPWCDGGICYTCTKTSESGSWTWDVPAIRSDIGAWVNFRLTTSTASSSSSSASIGNIKLSQSEDQKSTLSDLRLKISKLLVGNGINKKSSPVSSFTATVYDAISSFASEIKMMVTKIFSASAADPRENYFVLIKDDLTQPSVKDNELEPETVYAYRVRIKYNDGKRSAWNTDKSGNPQWLSGKTLPLTAVSVGGTPSPICTRNSYCDTSILKKLVAPPFNEKSEIQCKENADCANIGRKRQTTEEQ